MVLYISWLAYMYNLEDIYKQIETQDAPLSDSAKAMIKHGVEHIVRPQQTKEQTNATIEAMQQAENGNNNTRFSLQDDQFQVTVAREDAIVRIKISTDTEQSKIQTKVVSTNDSISIDFDDTPNVLQAKADLNADKKPVIAFLGFVKQGSADAARRLTNEARDALVKKFGHFGILTAGYRGFHADVYGITRAGYDCASGHNNIARLVVMPEVGKDDCHQNPEAKDVYGENWGDDTPALINASDAVIVFAPYGLITEIEIATALKAKKPVIVINENIQRDDEQTIAASCHVYSSPIYVCNNVERAIEIVHGRMGDKDFDGTTPIFNSRWLFDKKASAVKSPVRFTHGSGGRRRQGWVNGSPASSPAAPDRPDLSRTDRFKNIGDELDFNNPGSDASLPLLRGPSTNNLNISTGSLGNERFIVGLKSTPAQGPARQVPEPKKFKHG